MPQFFVRSADIDRGRCVIGGEDFRHLVTVRRVRINDRIALRTDTGLAVYVRVVKIGEKDLEAEVIEERPAPENGLHIDLYLALLKGKNFDLAVQKATEIGVARIVPIRTERSIPSPGDDGAKRTARWRRIAREAAKQSMATGIPEVSEIRSFDESLGEPGEMVKIIAHPAAQLYCRDFNPEPGEAGMAILVGPEGGFSPSELERAAAAGWEQVGFGATQLRAETAAIVIPALAICLWGDR